jgi:protein-tyrosine phosphatase
MVDFHSHILPKIDDGSDSLETSIAMLRMEAEQGIRYVIATPHFYPRHDTPAHFLRCREHASLILQEEMSRHTGLPEVITGAEVHYFRGISDSEFLPQLTIAGKKCILIEMPPLPWDIAMLRELESIYTRWNILPVIAHIDRYVLPLRSRALLKQLAQLPVLVQSNASFFLDRATSGLAMRMLRTEQIHLLGSDCHNMKDRMPNLGDAVGKITKKMGADPIVHIRETAYQLLQLD